MRITSHNIILDEYIEDESFSLLLDENLVPLYCVLHNVDPVKNKKKIIVLAALKNKESFYIYTRRTMTDTKGNIKYKKMDDINKTVKEFYKIFKTETLNTWMGGKDYKLRNNTLLFSTGEKIESISKDESSETCPIVDKRDFIDSSCEFLLSLLIESTNLINTYDYVDIINKGVTESGKCEKEENYYIPMENFDKISTVLYKAYIDLEEKIEIDSEKITKIYYGLIPLSRSNIKFIKTKDDIISKLEEIENLKNISYTISIIKPERIINDENKVREPNNSIVNLYSKLGYKIKKASDYEYSNIMTYIDNSKGSTHSNQIKIIDILSMENKEKEEIYLSKYKDDHRELLFHGSRLVNWVSIINKGLLLDSSKVADKISGKMFGNGIYWANCVSKSALYSISNDNKKQICIMALADVALGKSSIKYSSCNCPDGYDSVYGVGKYSYTKFKEITPNVYIPDQGLELINKETYLEYDEKIIYKDDRYIFKYLIIFELN